MLKKKTKRQNSFVAFIFYPDGRFWRAPETNSLASVFIFPSKLFLQCVLQSFILKFVSQILCNQHSCSPVNIAAARNIFAWECNQLPSLPANAPSVAKKNEKTNLTEIKTKTKTKPKTKRVKLPTGGRFAPPSQVPPLLFSVSFSFSF